MDQNWTIGLIYYVFIGPFLRYIALPLAVSFIGYRLARKKFGLSGTKAAGIALTAFLTITGCNYYLLLIWNPLPSDEEMIAHFQAHRADFEEIVRRYREYPAKHGLKSTPWDWYKEGDTTELLIRAGIDRVKNGGDIWLPNPYSVETAIKIDRLFANYMKDIAPFPFSDTHGDLVLEPAPQPRTSRFNRFSQANFAYGSISKSYYFFPEVPRIENGILQGPLKTDSGTMPGAVFHEKEGVWTWQFHYRVLSTLNRFPLCWQRRNASYEYNLYPYRVYRQIEPHWFLKMGRTHYFVGAEPLHFMKGGQDGKDQLLAERCQ